MFEFPSAAKIVIVESPYAGNVSRNERYARACVRDCLNKGEAPYASHLLYTQEGVLRDSVPEERARGMKAGFAFYRVADTSVVYTDLGVSRGMNQGIAVAIKLGVPVEYRTLPEEVMADIMYDELLDAMRPDS